MIRNFLNRIGFNCWLHDKHDWIISIHGNQRVCQRCTCMQKKENGVYIDVKLTK